MKTGTKEFFVDFLSKPSGWMRYPLCPVKSRTRKEPDCNWSLLGIVVAGRAVVYIINLLLLKPGKLGPQLENLQKYEYSSFEEMVDDGWIVD